MKQRFGGGWTPAPAGTCTLPDVTRKHKDQGYRGHFGVATGLNPQSSADCAGAIGVYEASLARSQVALEGILAWWRAWQFCSRRFSGL